MKKLVFVLAAGWNLAAWSQTADCNIVIQGRVLEIETDIPIEFASVLVAGTDQGTSTDENGHFEIKNVCPGEIDIEVSHVSYKKLSHHHDLRHGSPIIYLAPLEIELEGIVLEEKKDRTQVKAGSEKVASIGVSGLGTNAGKLTEQISGVSTYRTGPNIFKPMVHGLHSNRVLIINNGVRHAYQAWGQEHAPEIDAAALEYIKLIKGAGTVRYGPDALGGVILYQKERPTFDSNLGGSVASSYETNGRAPTFNLNLNQGYHRLAWRAGFSARKQGDLQSPYYELTNTGSKEIGGDINILLHRETFDVEVFASHFEQNLGILRGSVVGNLEDLAFAIGSEPPNDTRPFSYDIRNPRQETAHSLVKVKSAFFFSDYELTAQYAFQKNQRQEFDIRRGTNNQRPSIDLTLNSHTLDIDFTYPSKTVQGVLGVQGFLQDNNNNPGTNTIPFVPNYNISNLGVFTIQSIEKGNSLYELGARYDYQFSSVRGRDSGNDLFRNEQRFHNVTFLAGFSNQLNSKWKFTTNVASAWRPPNVGELYSFGKHQFNYEYGIWRYELDDQGNISSGSVLGEADKPVKSERGVKWINELTYTHECVQSEFVFYVNHISDYFFLRPFGITNTVRGPFPYFIWDQTDARLIGADWDVRLAHSKGWRSELKIAYVSALDLRSDQYFLEIPPFNVSYRLEKNWKKLSAGWELEHTARQNRAPKVIEASEFVDGTAEVSSTEFFDLLPAPKGYTLLHADVAYDHKMWHVSISGQNLLNRAYRVYTDRLRYFSDNPGANFKVTIKYGF